MPSRASDFVRLQVPWNSIPKKVAPKHLLAICLGLKYPTDKRTTSPLHLAIGQHWAQSPEMTYGPWTQAVFGAGASQPFSAINLPTHHIALRSSVPAIKRRFNLLVVKPLTPVI